MQFYNRKDSDVTQRDALVYGTGIFFMTIVSGISSSHMMFKGIYVGTKVRVAVTNLIYQKVKCVHITMVQKKKFSYQKFLSGFMN